MLHAVLKLGCHTPAKFKATSYSMLLLQRPSLGSQVLKLTPQDVESTSFYLNPRKLEIVSDSVTEMVNRGIRVPPRPHLPRMHVISGLRVAAAAAAPARLPCHVQGPRAEKEAGRPGGGRRGLRAKLDFRPWKRWRALHGLHPQFLSSFFLPHCSGRSAEKSQQIVTESFHT